MGGTTGLGGGFGAAGLATAGMMGMGLGGAAGGTTGLGGITGGAAGLRCTFTGCSGGLATMVVFVCWAGFSLYGTLTGLAGAAVFPEGLATTAAGREIVTGLGAILDTVFDLGLGASIGAACLAAAFTGLAFTFFVLAGFVLICPAAGFAVICLVPAGAGSAFGCS